jgi:hypothetical protein
VTRPRQAESEDEGTGRPERVVQRVSQDNNERKEAGRGQIRAAQPMVGRTRDGETGGRVNGRGRGDGGGRGGRRGEGASR